MTCSMPKVLFIMSTWNIIICVQYTITIIIIVIITTNCTINLLHLYKVRDESLYTSHTVSVSTRVPHFSSISSALPVSTVPPHHLSIYQVLQMYVYQYKQYNTTHQVKTNIEYNFVYNIYNIYIISWDLQYLQFMTNRDIAKYNWLLKKYSNVWFTMSVLSKAKRFTQFFLKIQKNDGEIDNAF